jgi:hypothetical protein
VENWMGVLLHLMDGFAGFKFLQHLKQWISPHIFPGTISVTVLMFKQLAMRHVDFFCFH